MIVTTLMMSKVMKEAKTKKKQIFGNKSKWYQFHAGNQEVTDGVAKEH